MSKDREIRELFARHKVELDRDDIWAVQGTPVVKHKAVERLGAALCIAWDKPQIVLAERDAVAILVAGNAANGFEWSIGEAVVQPMRDTGRKNDRGKPIYEPEGIGNYAITPKQAAYPYAMAEKRGKDRVILKLAGLQGVYSEEEADDFKSRDPEPSNAAREAISHPAADSVQLYIDKSRRYIENETRVANLKAWWLREADIRADFGLVEGDTRHDLLKSFFIEKGKKLAAASVIRGPEAA